LSRWWFAQCDASCRSTIAPQGQIRAAKWG
jgi:hypothetical protein